MLSTYEASSGLVSSEDLVYLPPEAIKTIAAPTEAEETMTSSTTFLADPDTLLTPEANVYSFG